MEGSRVRRREQLIYYVAPCRLPGDMTPHAPASQTLGAAEAPLQSNHNELSSPEVQCAKSAAPCLTARRTPLACLLLAPWRLRPGRPPARLRPASPRPFVPSGVNQGISFSTRSNTGVRRPGAVAASGSILKERRRRRSGGAVHKQQGSSGSDQAAQLREAKSRPARWRCRLGTYSRLTTDQGDQRQKRINISALVRPPDWRRQNNSGGRQSLTTAAADITRRALPTRDNFHPAQSRLKSQHQPPRSSGPHRIT